MLVPVIVLACAPEQPPATTSCTSLTECPISQLCDRSTRSCIVEPENRFLGAFECIFARPKDVPLQPSEIIGRIGTTRLTLPSATCSISETGSILFGFSNPTTSAGLGLILDPVQARAGRVTIGPAYDEPSMAYLETSTTRLGSATSGFIEIEGEIVASGRVTGYLDLEMLPASAGAALWGKPCPNGIAECGEALRSAGGVPLCSVVAPESQTHVCTGTCTTDADCAVGGGACIDGICTTACTKDSDCTPPTRCVAGLNGRGCF